MLLILRGKALETQLGYRDYIKKVFCCTNHTNFRKIGVARFKTINCEEQIAKDN